MDRYKWRDARSSDYDSLQSLLHEREESWVSLADRFATANGVWHTDFTVFEDRTQNGHLVACLYLNGQGMGILAVSPLFKDELDENSLAKLRKNRFQQLFCLIGDPEYVLRLQYAIPIPAIASTRYNLMNRPAPLLNSKAMTHFKSKAPWPASPGNGQEWHGLQLRRAQPIDASSMFELQAMYELEEVLVPGHHMNNDATRRQLEHNLNNQCIWVAASGNLMVAKAGTNARSWHYAQIGGVFTLPAWRNRGIGEQLMKALLQDIFSAGLGACLFVKQINAPALQLYEKLGFNPTGELIISYF